MSVDRIKKYMNQNDFKEDHIIYSDEIKLKGSFKIGNFVLKDLDLEFQNNKLILIVGDQGSGKSTLLKAFSGELISIGKTLIHRPNSCSYFCQNNFILPITIAENITFYETIR